MSKGRKVLSRPDFGSLISVNLTKSLSENTGVSSFHCLNLKEKILVSFLLWILTPKKISRLAYQKAVMINITIYCIYCICVPYSNHVKKFILFFYNQENKE